MQETSRPLITRKTNTLINKYWNWYYYWQIYRIRYYKNTVLTLKRSLKAPRLELKKLEQHLHQEILLNIAGGMTLYLLLSCLLLFLLFPMSINKIIFMSLSISLNFLSIVLRLSLISLLDALSFPLNYSFSVRFYLYCPIYFTIYF